MTFEQLLRGRLKLGDKAFAAVAGINRTLVHGYRTGRTLPTRRTLAKMVAAFDKLGVPVTQSQLLGSLPSHRGPSRRVGPQVMVPQPSLVEPGAPRIGKNMETRP